MSSPWWNAMCVRAMELLGDRKWHDYESVRKDIMVLIPPAVAVRRNEADRRSQLRRKKGPTARIPKRKRPISEERAILSGQKAISRDMLNTDLFAKRERSGPTGPIKEVRLVREPRRVRLAAEREERLRAAQAARAEERAGDAPIDQGGEAA